MKQIKLTQGKLALVDDEDYESLNQWKWFAKKAKGNTYAVRTVSAVRGEKKSYRSIFMHRLILGLQDSKVFCDHKDHDGLNNQRYNLRPCDNKLNCKNKRSSAHSSKYLGVSLIRKTKRYNASICLNGKSKHLGNYSLEVEAGKAYNIAAKLFFGEFANLNKI